MKPKISVVMPVYNQENYLAETIESVLNQTIKDYEFLIVDDGSTDSSAQIIRDYAAKDKRIAAFYEKNKGKSLATNYLVAKANGEFCAFLDADDVMLPNRLEKQFYFHVAHPDIEVSSCHCEYINNKGKTLGKQRYPGLKTVEECKQAFKDNNIIMCAFTGMMTTKKSYLMVGGLRKKMSPCEDLDFFNRVVEEGFSLVIIQDVLMKYRLHSSAVTTRKPLHMFNVMRYTTHCALLRRAGKEEIKFDSYINLTKSDPFCVKFKKKRYTYCQILFRRAGISLICQKYFGFLWQASLATILAPELVFYKAKNLLSRSV